MNKKAPLVLCLFLVGLFWLAVLPASAHPLSQGVVINTPTPGADGRILYRVKGNDTCLSISLLMKIPLDTLRKNNNLNAECVIRTGQDLLLAIVEPTQTPAVSGPAPTATSLLPTPTAFNGTAKVCVFLYDDLNGSAMRQEGELALADGAISLTDRSGQVSLTLKTISGEEPVCFDTVPEGDYNISVAVPEGYNPTTAMNYALKVQAGDQSMLDFGAQVNSQVAPLPAASQPAGRSPLLGIVGGLLLVGGVGLGVYVRRIGK